MSPARRTCVIAPAHTLVKVTTHALTALPVLPSRPTAMKRTTLSMIVLALLSFALPTRALADIRLGSDAGAGSGAPSLVSWPIVFVSRQIPNQGTIYWNVPRDLPGVGPHSRFRVATPGRLIRRNADGALITLVDGALPTPQSLQLIDVNAPDVSFDGARIVFAGLPAGSYDLGPVNNPGAWRIYSIAIDGSDLRQLTFTDQNLDYSQFGDAGPSMTGYDDTDPCWLPDGRIVFSSTRWPSRAHYSGVRTSNLHVMNADGSDLHRITSERNGADRPVVDPLTGKIVFARWWRNHRFPLASMETIPDPNGGYEHNLGLTADRNDQLGGPDALWRNAWQLESIRPDGAGLAMFSGAFREESNNHVYGGAFRADGRFYANFFPMENMTEASGFGGIRLYERGPARYTPVLGITYHTLDFVHPANPTSYGVYNGSYAAEPAVLPDGRLLISWAPDVAQDYGLYVADADGGNRTLLYDAAGSTEVRARVIAARPVPPVLVDQFTQHPSPLPPTAEGPYDQDGTFSFDALNVYFNAPVDQDIVSAPAIGSASSIRFFLDHQRTSPGSFPNLDWPILLEEAPVAADGSVRVDDAPANLPLFEQLRTAPPTYTVPLTGGPYADGAAHVAGLNYGRPGAEVKCVGCHAGHTMIPLPATAEEARWTNLAPGATLSVSSERDPNYRGGLIDRRVRKGEIWRYWNSAPGATQGQWVKLAFPVPVVARTVRLYNPRFGDEANSTIVVQQATVRLYDDVAGTHEVGSRTLGPLSVDGTDFAFAGLPARVVKVEIDNVTGTFYGIHCAVLAEVEVIARGGDSAPSATPAVESPLRALAYPNPFRESTRLVYRTAIAGPVDFQLFDPNGRRVAHWSEPWRATGTYGIPVTPPAAGVYLYRLAVGARLLEGKLTRVD